MYIDEITVKWTEMIIYFTVTRLLNWPECVNNDLKILAYIIVRFILLIIITFY